MGKVLLLFVLCVLGITLCIIGAYDTRKATRKDMHGLLTTGGLKAILHTFIAPI